ncbi:hypothetical protein [Streptomyces sp. NPDC059010]|uniref:hypothetical protein n=1 Tax=Streptomyces sp. NPDC059010 TaxID=3346695 RepID=UPI00369C32D0
MATQQVGRTAPWAKALGAVLLALVATLIVAHVVGGSREQDREDSAFEATRADARHFADAVIAQHSGPPHDRQDIQRALDSAAGTKNGLLYALDSTEDRTRAVVQFSRTYRRSMPILGPAQTTVDRCFTVVLRGPAPQTKAEITAHDADETCAQVAR